MPFFFTLKSLSNKQQFFLLHGATFHGRKKNLLSLPRANKLIVNPTNDLILGIYMNLVLPAACPLSCFSVKTTGMWKNFQGVSQGDDKIEDKKV